MNFKKKFVAALGLAGVIVLLSQFTVFAATVGSVNGDNVNVRNEPNKASDVITQLNYNDAVDIIGKEDDFYKIMVDGAELYISEDFVDVLNAEGVSNGTNVNVRTEPNTDSEILGRLDLGESVTVIGDAEDWIMIEYDGASGYVKGDYIDAVFEDGYEEENTPDYDEPDEDDEYDKDEDNENDDDSTYAVVSSDTGLRLRERASTESDVLTLVPSGAAIDVLDEEDDWVMVAYGGLEGYVSSEFVKMGSGARPAYTDNGGSGLANQAIEYGKQFLGTPYKWAGNDLNAGVDCSGFVYNVYKHFGVSLNRSSSAMASNGSEVDKSGLQPGDLVLFDTTGDNDGNISHVGIYMGGGEFIHSSSSKRTWGVTISSLEDEYYIRTYVTARRIV